MTGNSGGTCFQTVKLLQEYIDRELTSNEVTTVQGHLDRCPPCLKLFCFEEGVRRLVRVHCTSDCAPTSLREEILARLRRPRA